MYSNSLNLDTPKKLALILLTLSLVIASIKPLHYPSYILHQIGTLMMVVFLLWLNRRLMVSHLAFFGYIVFLIIHIFAAHWLYSYVPYNEWFIDVFAFDVNQTLGFGRNMFDRVVHFAYGFLLYPIIFEMLKYWLSPLNDTKKIHGVSIGFIMASSMFYEVIEWWIAIFLSSENAENYNGQQGDIWDAHQDMFLATVASVLAAATGFFKRF